MRRMLRLKRLNLYTAARICLAVIYLMMLTALILPVSIYFLAWADIPQIETADVGYLVLHAESAVLLLVVLASEFFCHEEVSMPIFKGIITLSVLALIKAFIFAAASVHIINETVALTLATFSQIFVSLVYILELFAMRAAIKSYL